MSIVCGTDFSEQAGRAVDAAFSIARRFHEPLFAAHVLDGTVANVPDENVRWSVKERTLDLLRAEAKRFGDTGEAFEAAALSGPPEEALAEFGRQHGARLLVVSAFGKRHGPWWSLGTTTERLAAASRLPVLAVRDAEPFEAWSFGKRALRVLLAITRDLPSGAAARWISAWRKAGPCDLTVVTFYTPSEERERLGLGGPRYAFEPIPEAETVLKRELRTILDDPTGSGSLEFLALKGQGDPAAHIIRLARSLPVDLIVLGTHLRRGMDRLWRGSVSHGVLTDAPCSVACVPCGEIAGMREAAIRTVLAATDFTEAGNRAVAFAHLVAPPGGTVQVLHVIEGDSERLRATQYAGFATGKDATPEERARLSQALSGRLSRIASAFERTGVETRVEIVEGMDPARAIVQAARRLGADIICLGAHPRGIPTSFGHTPQWLLQDIDVPLLIVPDIQRD